MTRTSTSHIIGEAGTAAVLKACNSGGWIGEHVRVDYGEDLVFQTSFRSEVDPFRIYAQCKSTAGRPSRVTLSRRHLLRWVLMGELVVVFLYTNSTDEIFYYEINERMAFLDIWQSSKTRISIPTSEFQIFNAAALRRLEWLSRMRGMSFLISKQFSDRQMSEQLVEIHSTPAQILSMRFNEIEAGLFFLFLRYIDFMKSRDGTYVLNLEGKIKPTLERIERRLLGGRRSKNAFSIHELLALVILAEWEDLSGGLGLNTLVMTGASFWLNVFVSSHFNEQGHDLKKLVRIRL